MVCADRTLLPRSLHFELPENLTGVVLYRGGFADVSKCEVHGREVAIKTLRRKKNGSQDIVSVSYQWSLSTCTFWRTEHGICRGSARRS